MLVITADAADSLAALGVAIPIIGPALPLLSWFYGITISGIILFWLIMKGVSVRWFLGGSGIEFIPFVNALPARTATLLATFMEDDLPEGAKAAVGAATGKKMPPKQIQRAPTQQAVAPAPEQPTSA